MYFFKQTSLRLTSKQRNINTQNCERHERKKCHSSPVISHSYPHSSIHYQCSDCHKGNGEKWSTKPPSSPPPLFFFFFKLGRWFFLLFFPAFSPFLAWKKNTNTQESLIRRHLLEKGWTLHQNKFCSESRDIYHISPIATCSHKDYCIILSVDAAARCWLILRVWSSKKGKSIFKNKVI